MEESGGTGGGFSFGSPAAVKPPAPAAAASDTGTDDASLSLPPTPPAETLLAGDAEVCAAADRVAQAMKARPFEAEWDGRIVAVTWNVWFSPYAFDQRLRALLLEVMEVMPDCVGLQEVTPRFEAALRGCAPLCQAYSLSPFPVGHYGCLVLVRRTLHAHFRLVDLPSDMSRCLVAAEIYAGSSPSSSPKDPPVLVFATVHLESLNSEQTRRKQLTTIRAFFDAPSYRCAAHLLCGDFNFDDRKSWGDWRRRDGPRVPSEQLENRCLKEILPHMVDCWDELRRKGGKQRGGGGGGGGDRGNGDEDDDEDGATFSGRSNACCVGDAGEVMRYDRFLFAPPTAPASSCFPWVSSNPAPAAPSSSSAASERGGAVAGASDDCAATSIRRMGTEPFPLAPRHRARCYHAESLYPPREVKEVEPSGGGSEASFSSPSERRALMKASDHYGLCLEITGFRTG